MYSITTHPIHYSLARSVHNLATTVVTIATTVITVAKDIIGDKYILISDDCFCAKQFIYKSHIGAVNIVYNSLSTQYHPTVSPTTHVHPSKWTEHAYVIPTGGQHVYD